MLLPLLVAGVLEAFGSLRTASSLRRPPRGLSGHVVLLGLGKIGTRVLVHLRELGIPVVCVEEDPDARGIPVARRLHVPVVLGDVTDEGVLEAAKISRSRGLLALTSIDTTNLEAALYARSLKPNLRVTVRLFDDEFATAVYRTLRTAHPQAITRSRSVSHLAGPSFAVAMMGGRSWARSRSNGRCSCSPRSRSPGIPNWRAVRWNRRSARARGASWPWTWPRPGPPPPPARAPSSGTSTPATCSARRTA